MFRSIVAASAALLIMTSSVAPASAADTVVGVGCKDTAPYTLKWGVRYYLHSNTEGGRLKYNNENNDILNVKRRKAKCKFKPFVNPYNDKEIVVERVDEATLLVYLVKVPYN